MKNIIALSDGTGNGAAKRNRTNVWRLYRALDLERDDQIVFYDDGVGSQEFLLFKLLGGMFGWGLKRNVIELYKFLCRTYQRGAAGSPGDRIYLFGFSRGAFTVRVLAGLIEDRDLYTSFTDEDDLHRTAKRNYSAYRSKFKRGFLYRLFRVFFRAKKNSDVEPKAVIEFIGVWDTVDAYGLPIDELAEFWDKLVYQIRLPDRRLPGIVNRACHAISIDDERRTFHPVLWDESQACPDKIEQVWFSGAHSDVGGGYPRYTLSLVTLDWMISKVEAPCKSEPGLHFIKHVREEYHAQSDWNGLQHDSRSGFAAYYRYKPREIARICNDSRNGVIIEKPKIHHSVFERIKLGVVPYAPMGLPDDYDVAVTRGVCQDCETPETATARAKSLNRALDIVLLRKWLYWAFIGTSLVLAATPLFLSSEPGRSCIGRACLFEPVLGFVKGALPSFTEMWFDTLLQNPGWLWGFVGAYASFIILKLIAAKATRTKATAAWATLKGRGSPPKWNWTLLSLLRAGADSTVWRCIKFTLSLFLFALILYVLIVGVFRMAFHFQSTMGLLCESSAMPEPIADGDKTTLDIESPCFATGFKLEQGVTYYFTVEPEEWKDGPVGGDPQWITSLSPIMWLGVPFLRVVSEPYIKLMGRIGDTGAEEFVIGAGPAHYTAKTDGELFLYVNDAVFGLFPDSYWALSYSWSVIKNGGTAEVSVSRADKMDKYLCTEDLID